MILNVYIICHYEITLICVGYIHKFSLLLSENPQIEVSVLVGLKRGGDDEVLPRREGDVVAHLPQVDEGLGACR